MNVARYLGRADAGTLARGNVADLILISGNPLVDITATQRIEGVIVDGRWLSREYIGNALSDLSR